MIVVNILWFSSLILSLISASIGILVRQWLQEYLASTSSQPYDSVCMRQYRYMNYEERRVNTFLKMLPFLLQLSLLLFFTGMPIFLWSADPTVAGFVTTLIIAWLICWLLAIIHPALVPGSPYKSAEASALFTLVNAIQKSHPQFHSQISALYQRLLRFLLFRFRTALPSGSASSAAGKTWRDEEVGIVQIHRNELGRGLLERAKDVLLDKLVLANALHAYLQEKDVRRHDMREFVLEQLVQLFDLDRDDLWAWKPDNSPFTCAWMKVCVLLGSFGGVGSAIQIIVGYVDHQDEILIVIANVLYYHRRDFHDQQLIQDMESVLYKKDVGTSMPLLRELHGVDRISENSDCFPMGQFLTMLP